MAGYIVANREERSCLSGIEFKVYVVNKPGNLPQVVIETCSFRVAAQNDVAELQRIAGRSADATKVDETFTPGP
jgi:hypothetical protein